MFRVINQMPYINIDNKKIYYEINGNGSTVLLFLHCWTCNHTFWQEQVNTLSKMYKCITIDFPGHGLSEDAGNYTIDEFCRYVYVVTRKLRIRKFIIIGHSLGGMVALKLALDYSDLLAGMILIDTSAKLKRHLLQNVSSMLGIAGGKLVFPAIKRAVIDFSAVHPLTGWKTRKKIKDDIIKVPNNITVKTLKSIRSFDVIDTLGRITVPVLIMVGSMDIFTDIRHALTLYVRIPHSSLRLIGGAGHMSMLEQPGKVNAYIKEFISTLLHKT